jgi:hypothetical protein
LAARHHGIFPHLAANSRLFAPIDHASFSQMRNLTKNPLPMTLFALASASPLLLFALGIWAGGLWAFAGLVYMTALVAVLDQIKGLFMGDAPEGVVWSGLKPNGA